VFATATATATDTACARSALRQRVTRDLEHLRSLARVDDFLTDYVESRFAPEFEQLLTALHEKGDLCEAARAPASAALAPEWGRFSELILSVRLNWQATLARLPVLAESRRTDSAAVCRVRRSAASIDRVLRLFQAGCERQPLLKACGRETETAGLGRQRTELDSRLELDLKRYKEKWGERALEKLNCL
jgi:hypothetical protein